MNAARAALLVAAMTAACRAPEGASQRARVDRLVSSPQPSSGTLRSSLWSVAPSGAMPGAVGDIGALDRGEAIVLAAGVIYRWSGLDAVEPVCARERAEASTCALVSVQADGERFVVLGGDESEPVVWWSEDRGASCSLTRLPSLFVRDAPRAALGQSLHGDVAFAWGTTGAVVRSEDGGRSWRRLPSLEGVLDVAPAPSGRTVAAAVVGLRVEHARARLYALDATATAWRAVERAETLRAPVSLSVVEDGVRVAHCDGALSLDASLAVTATRVDVASRYAAHRPTIIAPASGGRFLSTTRSLLSLVDADAVDALAALAGAREISAIDAARDGWFWATDGRGIWRGRADAPFAEVSSHPLGGQVPVALAARGDRTLVVGNGRAVAWRDAARPAWRRASIPSSVGAVLAAHIDAQGTHFVLGSSGLAVSDAGEFVVVPSASLPLSNGMMPIFTVMGDRWVIASGAVFASEDHGARWEATFGGPGNLTLGAHAASAPAMTQRPSVLAASVNGSGVLVLDQMRSLWRSDDGAATFARLATVPGTEEPPFLARSVLSVIAWDGARRIAVLHRGEMQVSVDEGRTFTTAPVPFSVRWATFVGDHLVAAGGGASTLLPPACHLDDASTLFVYTDAGWVTEPDPCARRASLLASDGASIWFVDAALTVQRASLAAIVAEATRR